mgnify:CR=1 FL=1
MCIRLSWKINRAKRTQKACWQDKLDTVNVVFDDEYGVEIDGEKTSDYTFTGGVLSVNLPDVSDGASLTVTFQVTQA